MVTTPFSTGEIPTANFVMSAGSYMLLKVTVRDKTGAVFNITGMTLNFGMYDIVTGVEILTKVSPTEIAFIDAINGRANIILEKADTLSLLGRYYYALHATDTVPTPNRPKKVLKGEVLIELSRVTTP